jgi:hypothetical protein
MRQRATRCNHRQELSLVIVDSTAIVAILFAAARSTSATHLRTRSPRRTLRRCFMLVTISAEPTSRRRSARVRSDGWEPGVSAGLL